MVAESDELDRRVRELLHRHAAVGFAVAVVRGGETVWFRGHGVADIGAGVAITEDTVFRIGSLTKTFTAIAVLQLVEQGEVDLDGPARDYLRAYRLVGARPAHRAPTVRQLLTHTAGLPELLTPTRVLAPVLGETVAHGRAIPTLAEFYGGALRLVTEPGTCHTYSNHGFATLGQIVSDVSNQPLARVLRERVFDPLGMDATDLVRSDHVRERLAIGYTLRANGPRPVADRDLVTAGAGAIYSSSRDMGRYAAALLAGGANEHGSVLRPQTVASMFAPQYQPDPRIPGMGLAFFRHTLAGHPTVDHDGLMPGFSSQLMLAPDDGVGILAFTNGVRGGKQWLGTEVSELLRSLLGLAPETIRGDLAHRPHTWGALCGWYEFPGALRDIQKWFITGARVAVHRGGLTLRVISPIPALSRHIPLWPEDEKDPDVFRADLTALGMGVTRVVFTRDPDAAATALHLDAVPLSFHRRVPRPRAAAANRATPHPADH
ncbi:serine hydrolase domain-containing protein [Nocardia seriolae]|nr:serine hydrolase domain-containing protein [Nocardia seriolae]MTJ63922.1 serine hydrolase [Nocardia seriolae]MTJ71029.1 serine hydrolase [Nocardia seriolae]MTJ88648.1 serine hydrolase [Nocardia seriolae]MTK32628.1 serine hydrolase [Nocardia seriolae]MTK41812.1 serine hydrolase [Nocardia seriolae]